LGELVFATPVLTDAENYTPIDFIILIFHHFLRPNTPHKPLPDIAQMQEPMPDFTPGPALHADRRI